MTSWQPIETAPKDGTRVDLWVRWKGDGNHCARVTDAWWGRGEVEEEDGFHDGMNWTYLDEYVQHYISLNAGIATHWMPLPDPPND